MPPISSPGLLAADNSKPIFITSRASVLSSLKTGDILAVKVLDRMDSQNVLLSIKGVPVTVKNLGNAMVGDSLNVIVETNGDSFLLRRVDIANQIKTDSLKTLVRFGIARNLISKTVVTGLDGFGQLKSTQSLPEILAKPLALIAGFMPELPNAAAIEKLFTLFGFKGQQISQKYLVENGTNSIYAALRRMVDTPAGKLKGMLTQSLLMDMDIIKELLQKSAILKRSIEIFRAANLLADRQGGTLSLPIPFGPEGQRNMVELFWNKGKGGKNGTKDNKVFTIYMRMRFSSLGEIRTLIRKGDGPMDIQFFADEKAGDILKERLDSLCEDLEKDGNGPRITFGMLGEKDDPDLSFQNNMVEIAGYGERLNIRA